MGVVAYEIPSDLILYTPGQENKLLGMRSQEVYYYEDL